MTTRTNTSLADVDRRFARSGRRSSTRRARRELRRPIVRGVLGALAAAAALAGLVVAAMQIDLSSGAQPARTAAARPGAPPPCPIPADFRGHFEAASARTGVSVAVLGAMAYEESRMDPVAKSHAGALGLLQVMPGTAREVAQVGGSPRANVMAGAIYLERMQRRFGNLHTALAAYNAGPTLVARHGPGPRSGAYAERVQQRAAVLARSCA